MNILAQELVGRDKPPLTEAQCKSLQKLLRPPEDAPTAANTSKIEKYLTSRTYDAHLELAEQAKTYIVWLLDVLNSLATPNSNDVEELASIMADFGGTTGIIAQIEGALKYLRETVDTVNQHTANAFAEAEVQNMNVRGKLVFMQSHIAAVLATSEGADDDQKTAERRQACAVFKEKGFDFLVSESIHAMRLSSWVKEHERTAGTASAGQNIVNEFDLPEEIKPYIVVTQRTDVRVRKGK